MTKVNLNCYHKEYHTPKLGDYYAHCNGGVYIIAKAGSWANSGYNLVNISNGELGAHSSNDIEYLFGDYAGEYTHIERVDINTEKLCDSEVSLDD